MKTRIKKIIEMRNRGSTYRQIVDAVGGSVSGVSYVCNKYCEDNKNISKTNAARSSSLLLRPMVQEKMKEASRKYYENKRRSAAQKWKDRLKEMPADQVFYMAGLYDGEGNHSGTEFRIANSDKRIIQFCIKFLRDIGCELTIELALHSTQDEEKCRSFWGENFDCVRQYDSRSQSKDNSNREYYGTVNIRVKKPLGLRDAIFDYSFSKS